MTEFKNKILIDYQHSPKKWYIFYLFKDYLPRINKSWKNEKEAVYL